MRSTLPRRRQPRPRSHRAGAPDENQRALDRLSYLGGILIPLPIISGVLSMGDVYGPDGGRFFVFWAVAVPLAGLAVLLIYADTIRKAEVWVEIGPERVVPVPEGKSFGGSGSSSSSTGGGGGGGGVDNAAAVAAAAPVDVEVMHTRTVTWRRRTGRSADEDGDGTAELEEPSPRQRNDAPFAVVDHDVEEQIIDTPGAASTEAEDDLDVLDWIPRAARWVAAGWSHVPSVILERPVDGSKPKAWKREQLGWGGAIQAALFKKFRDGSDLPDGVAAREKPGRWKANSV